MFRRHLFASQEDPQDDCPTEEPVEPPPPENHVEEPSSSYRPNLSDSVRDEDQTLEAHNAEQGPQQQSPPQPSPPPPERRSTRWRILRTPVRFKDYHKCWERDWVTKLRIYVSLKDRCNFDEL